jgi:hypothetical protein
LLAGVDPRGPLRVESAARNLSGQFTLVDPIPQVSNPNVPIVALTGSFVPLDKVDGPMLVEREIEVLLASRTRLQIHEKVHRSSGLARGHGAVRWFYGSGKDRLVSASCHYQYDPR